MNLNNDCQAKQNREGLGAHVVCGGESLMLHSRKGASVIWGGKTKASRLRTGEAGYQFERRGPSSVLAPRKKAKDAWTALGTRGPTSLSVRK